LGTHCLLARARTKRATFCQHSATKCRSKASANNRPQGKTSTTNKHTNNKTHKQSLTVPRWNLSLVASSCALQLRLGRAGKAGTRFAALSLRCPVAVPRTEAAGRRQAGSSGEAWYTGRRGRAAGRDAWASEGCNPSLPLFCLQFAKHSAGGFAPSESLGTTRRENRDDFPREEDAVLHAQRVARKQAAGRCCCCRCWV